MTRENDRKDPTVQKRNVKRTAVFRTPVLAVAGALAAVTALTACGPVKMGAAATIGDERITTARLDSTVAQWRKEFDKNSQAALVQQSAQQQGQKVPFDQDSPHRSALFQLVSFRVWDEVAKEQGATVTQGQVDRLLAGLGGQAGAAPSILASDIPVSYTTEVARTYLVQQELLQRNGLVPNGQAQLDPNARTRAIQQVTAAYTAAAEHLKITISPRFGAFDPQQVTFNPVAYRLSRTESGTG
jgi:hypothetical protein